MTLSDPEKLPPAACRLGAKLDLGAASELRNLLLAILAESGPVTLDGSAVTSIDTACLQILCAFAREASDAGRPLTWAGASPVLVETTRRLGLAGVLVLT